MSGTSPSSSAPHPPSTHRALVIENGSSSPTLTNLPTPLPTPGSAVVRILAAGVLAYMRDIYNGERGYTYPTPLIPGTSAIGRVAALGSDAAVLEIGDLVHVDCFIRGRDDPDSMLLSGIHDGFTAGSKKLMRGEWRDSTYAEYTKVPLENLEKLNESVLSGKLGYNVPQLQYLSTLQIPFGGLRDVGVQAGETVVVSPATGAFGSAAVQVALAMGARVVGVGRNVEVLETVKRNGGSRVEVVPITGHVDGDAASIKAAFGEADVWLDISPPHAAASTHFKSCFLSMKRGGRVSLMGGLMVDLPIPHNVVMRQGLTVKGKWMYERADVKALIRMVESGLLELGNRGRERKVNVFGLGEWDKAFSAAEEAGKRGIAGAAVIQP